MKIRITSILCPKCGAAVSFSEKDRVIRCPHCDMNFIPDHAQGIERYYFSPKLRDPLTALHHFLAAKGFKRSDYHVVDLDQFFVPVWRGIGHITGWIAGLSPFKTYEIMETVRTPTGGQMQVKRKRKEGGIPLRKLLRVERDMLLAAVKRNDIRWRIEEVLKDEYEPHLKIFDQDTMSKWGKIFTPDESPDIKRKELKQRFLQSALSMYLNYDPLHHRLKVIGERLYLYYFPLALVKVSINDELVSCTVNGITGTVSSSAGLEKKGKKRKTSTPLINTLMVFLAAILTSNLFLLESALAKQLAIAILIIVIAILWIKR